MDTERALAVFYPTAAPASAPATAPATTATTEATATRPSEDTVAATMYGERPEALKAREAVEAAIPPNIRELRRESAEAVLYKGESGFDPHAWDFALEGSNIAPEVAAAAVDEYHRIATDVGMTKSDVDMLLSTARTLGKPASAEQRNAWQAEAKQRIAEQYGAEADKVLADARRLVTRDPRLARVMDVTTLGDNPNVVLRFVELAREQRMRGRLK